MNELNQYPIDPYSLAKLFASYNPEEEVRKELFIKNCPHIEYEQDMGASIPFCQLDGNMCNRQCLKTPQRAIDVPPKGEKQNDCPLIEVSEDVQPVKHGKWGDSIAKYGILRHKCSVCNKYSHMAYNYCPNCGAKMDGET